MLCDYHTGRYLQTNRLENALTKIHIILLNGWAADRKLG